jgi:hypothetical protein
MLRKALSLLVFAALSSSASTLVAQIGPFEHTPNFEAYGGYSYVFTGDANFKTNQIVTNGAPGWDASFKVPILGALLGIKADLSGSWLKDGTGTSPNENPKQFYFMAGPQVGIHLGKSLLFAHGMIGGSYLDISKGDIPNFNPGTSFAIAAGGGLDAGLSTHWAWRVTGDFYNTNFKTPKTPTSGKDAESIINEISNSGGRVSTGPVFRF